MTDVILPEPRSAERALAKGMPPWYSRDANASYRSDGTPEQPPIFTKMNIERNPLPTVGSTDSVSDEGAVTFSVLGRLRQSETRPVRPAEQPSLS